MSGPWEQYQTAPAAPVVVAATADGPWSQYKTAAAPKPYDPTADMSTTDKVLAGTGKAMYDTARGAGQLARDYFLPTSFADKLGLPTQADADATKKLDAPLMSTTAGTVGYVGGNVASLLLPTGLLGAGAKVANMARTAKAAEIAMNPTTYKAAAAMGALQGAIQPVASGDSRGFNTALGAGGGLLGNGLVNAVGRIAQPVANTLDAVGQKAVDTFRSAGIPMDAAQMTGSPLLGRIKSALSDNPFTMGAQAAFQGKQAQGFNRAVLGTIGADANAATSDVMKDAAGRINGTFKDVLGRNNVTLTDPVLTQLGNTQKLALENEKQPVVNVINRIIDTADSNGSMPGQTAYNLKKDIDRMASTQDTTANYYARGARSALMDGINDSLSGADQAAFTQARGQFRNLKQIEPAISTDGRGDISAPRLANVLGQVKNRGQSMYGNGDQALVDLATGGKQLLQDKTPNSGSMARMAMQIAPSVIAGGADGAMSGDWVGAAKTAGTVAALPKLAQYLINNQATSNYLANGLKAGTLRSLLEAPDRIGLLGAGIRQSPASGFRAGLLSLSGN